MASSSVPYVYILRCVDNRLYVGHTDDLIARQCAHNEGVAAAFTAARRPVRIVYAEQYASLLTAMQREKQLKRWTRK